MGEVDKSLWRATAFSIYVLDSNGHYIFIREGEDFEGMSYHESEKRDWLGLHYSRVLDSADVVWMDDFHGAALKGRSRTRIFNIDDGKGRYVVTAFPDPPNVVFQTISYGGG